MGTPAAGGHYGEWASEGAGETVRYVNAEEEVIQ